MNKATWMMIAAVVLWGMSIAPTKWGLESFPPFTLTLLRLGLASLLFLPLAWRQAAMRGMKPRVPWRRLWILSFTGVAGYFMLGYSGIALTSGVHAGILQASLPLITMIFAACFLKERITVQQWLGLAMGLSGVLLISVQPEADGASSLAGDALVLASCLVWAVYVIQMKRPGDEAQLPSELFTALTLFLGAVMILPLAAAEWWLGGTRAVDAKAWGSVAYLTLGSTIAAYWLWNKALEQVSAGSAGIYLNALPLVSVVTAVSLLGEALTWRSVAGGSLILIGVFWAEHRRTASQLPAARPEKLEA